jgi:hypothetical protein
MSNASRGRFHRPLNVSWPSGAGPEVSIAVPVSLLDPQVMPRRLRIAPRLIMLAVLGRGRSPDRDSKPCQPGLPDADRRRIHAGVSRGSTFSDPEAAQISCRGSVWEPASPVQIGSTFRF